jgi:translation initiation factor 2 beta subunit (eIF-2beta)/eIF-5
MDFDFNTIVDEYYLAADAAKCSTRDVLILPALNIKIDVTRLHWKNVKEYLDCIDRNPKHFIKFLKRELPGKEIDWFSGLISDGLIIHGKRQRQTEITELARKYIDMFVICSSCKKADTQMNKIDSKYKFVCESCGFNKFIL